MKIGSFVIAVLFTVMIAGSPRAAETKTGKEWRPTATQISDIEGRVQLGSPEVNGPVESFDRYYAGVFRDGRRLILVEYVGLATMPRPNGTVHIVSSREIPAIADGGCGVIYFDYEPVTKQISTPTCNFDLRPPPPPPNGARVASPSPNHKPSGVR